VTDFLDDKRKEITDRLKELKPLVDEYSRLEAAASALAGVGGSAPAAATTTAAPRRRGPGRPRGSVNRASKAAATSAPAAAASTPAKAGRKKRGRPPGRPKGRVGQRKGSGTRAAQALSFVQGQPGITVPELAVKMGIKQNYLYRVLPGLEHDGSSRRRAGAGTPRWREERARSLPRHYCLSSPSLSHPPSIEMRPSATEAGLWSAGI
jgi:hypothetical protein